MWFCGFRPSIRGLTVSLDQSENQVADYVIAVIGQPMVGKTTIIRKAFRSWGLNEPEVRPDEEPRSRALSYTAQVETGQPPRMRVVRILEIDLNLLQSGYQDGHWTGGHQWPEEVPRVDGVMICYDAMDTASVEGLTEAIRECSADHDL